jgi:hypothetical protein
MPETHWHVRSALTGARVVIDVTEEQAGAECDRLNREAQTGERAAYDDGRGGTVEAQRLVPTNNGWALTARETHPDAKVQGAVLLDVDLLDPSHVGKVLHEGQPMRYEVEREERPTAEELEAAAREASA